MVKDIKKTNAYLNLKNKYVSKLRSFPDDGTCSLGHGTEIYKNGKKIDFWRASNYTQSDSPQYQVEKELSSDFKKLGLEIRHESGSMD